MKYKIKKKLIHFYTSGNIVEDFVASRRKKVSALRKVIRACFYLHCASALLCIGLSVLLGSAPVVVAITLCTVAAAWMALFAVGGSALMKLLLIAADTAITAAGFTAGALTSFKAAFFSSASVMVITSASAAALYIAARCRDFLEGYSPRLIRRDDYTLLHNFAPESEDIALSADDVLPPFPPLTSEMRELAIRLKEILAAPPEKEPEEEIIDEITHSSHESETEEKTPVENAR